jgi:3-hydroxyacyl-CoA dehydrogenase/enoyl-CoA hydratase/carnithine racemase
MTVKGTVKGSFIQASLQVREHAGLRFGLIILDDGREGTNAFGLPGLRSLAEALDAVEQADVDAVAVTGNRRWFSSGADLDMFRAAGERSQVLDVARLGHDVFRRLGESGRPTFAFISGVATGGGLELALHCHYRTLADHVVALALPECMLGLVPAWGGCYLTANLIGARGAVDLIVRNALSNGKQTKPARALDMGLVDALLPAAHFVDLSLQWATDVINGEREVRRNDVDRGDAWDDTLAKARTWVDGRVRGAAPAAYRALDLIALAKTASRDEGFAAEDATCADLVMTEQMRAALYAYELTTSRAPTAHRNDGGPITAVGIVGAGMMAGQLAALVLRTLEVPVVVAHRNEAGVDRATAVVEKVLEQQQRANAISADRAARLRELFTATTDRTRLAPADIVLEAVVEDAATKRQVVGDIADVVAPTCVIATGTSSLSVTDLAQSIPHPERFVGLHFFNPVDMLPLLEVVHTAVTDERTRATADAFGRRLGKVLVHAADRPAFVFNRLLLRFYGQVLRYAEEGTPLPDAEAALEPLGLPMAPTQMITFTGLPLITMITERLHDVFPDRFPAPSSLRALVDAGKTGFYIHQGGERIVDPEVYALAARPETLVVRTAHEVLEGALTALTEEIGLLLDEGVVDDAREIDLAMLVGGNFPLHLGGITPYLDRAGYSKRVIDRRFLPRGIASLP